jgi:hypothetical protein
MRFLVSSCAFAAALAALLLGALAWSGADYTPGASRFRRPDLERLSPGRSVPAVGISEATRGRGQILAGAWVLLLAGASGFVAGGLLSLGRSVRTSLAILAAGLLLLLGAYFLGAHSALLIAAVGAQGVSVAGGMIVLLRDRGRLMGSHPAQTQKEGST